MTTYASDGKKNGDIDQKQNSTPTQGAGNAADTSFVAQNGRFTCKLVYLPDFAHPMAIKVNSGLLGKTSFTPNLQDGWMFTGGATSVDSGGSEVAAAMGSTLSGAGGIIKALFDKAPSTGSGGGGGTDDDVIKTGLYEFTTDDAGHINGLHWLAKFPLPETDPVAISPPYYVEGAPPAPKSGK